MIPRADRNTQVTPETVSTPEEDQDVTTRMPTAQPDDVDDDHDTPTTVPPLTLPDA